MRKPDHRSESTRKEALTESETLAYVNQSLRELIPLLKTSNMAFIAQRLEELVAEASTGSAREV